MSSFLEGSELSKAPKDHGKMTIGLCPFKKSKLVDGLGVLKGVSGPSKGCWATQGSCVATRKTSGLHHAGLRGTRRPFSEHGCGSPGDHSITEVMEGWSLHAGGTPSVDEGMPHPDIYHMWVSLFGHRSKRIGVSHDLMK